VKLPFPAYQASWLPPEEPQAVRQTSIAIMHTIPIIFLNFFIMQDLLKFYIFSYNQIYQHPGKQGKKHHKSDIKDKMLHAKNNLRVSVPAMRDCKTGKMKNGFPLKQKNTRSTAAAPHRKQDTGRMMSAVSPRAAL